MHNVIDDYSATAGNTDLAVLGPFLTGDHLQEVVVVNAETACNMRIGFMTRRPASVADADTNVRWTSIATFRLPVGYSRIPINYKFANSNTFVVCRATALASDIVGVAAVNVIERKGHAPLPPPGVIPV